MLPTMFQPVHVLQTKHYAKAAQEEQSNSAPLSVQVWSWQHHLQGQKLYCRSTAGLQDSPFSLIMC